MAQAAGRLGFPQEALLGLGPLPGVGQNVEPDGFDGNGPADDRIDGLVDDAHRPAAELAFDKIFADALFRHGRSRNGGQDAADQASQKRAEADQPGDRRRAQPEVSPEKL